MKYNKNKMGYEIKLELVVGFKDEEYQKFF